MKVFVYFNLHKKLWSVRALEGKDKGRVIAHADELALSDCTFKVSEISRQKVLRERRKNIHAGVVGNMDTCKLTKAWNKAAGVQISYNPYRGPDFYEVASQKPVFAAKRVLLQKDRKVLAFQS